MLEEWDFLENQNPDFNFEDKIKIPQSNATLRGDFHFKKLPLITVAKEDDSNSLPTTNSMKTFLTVT